MLHVFVFTCTCKHDPYVLSDSPQNQHLLVLNTLHISIFILISLSDVSELSSQTIQEHGASSTQLDSSISFSLSRHSSNAHQNWCFPLNEDSVLCVLWPIWFLLILVLFQVIKIKSLVYQGRPELPHPGFVVLQSLIM